MFEVRPLPKAALRPLNLHLLVTTVGGLLLMFGPPVGLRLAFPSMPDEFDPFNGPVGAWGSVVFLSMPGSIVWMGVGAWLAGKLCRCPVCSARARECVPEGCRNVHWECVRCAVLWDTGTAPVPYQEPSRDRDK